MLKVLLGFILGFSLKFFGSELVNYNIAQSFKSCMAPDPTKAYFAGKLPYCLDSADEQTTFLGRLLIYQPEWWDYQKRESEELTKDKI